MLVLRLEHRATRQGIYSLGALRKAGGGGDYVNHRPAPEEDGLHEFHRLPDATQWRFGFRDAAQLFEWFDRPAEWAAMERAHVVVSAYEVPDELVREGQRQLVFFFPQARLRATTSVLAFRARWVEEERQRQQQQQGVTRAFAEALPAGESFEPLAQSGAEATILPLSTLNTGGMV